jgi:hypothetical protein
MTLCPIHVVIVGPRCQPDVLATFSGPISLTLNRFPETLCGFVPAVDWDYMQTFERDGLSLSWSTCVSFSSC